MFSCGQPLGASSKAGEMMTAIEKQAKALGLNSVKYKRVGRDYHPVLMKEREWFWRKVDGKALCFPGRYIVRTNKQLEAWLASPAGREAVRDKVRELCNADKKIKRITYTHSTCNWKEIPDTHTIELLGVSCYVQADTEAGAYAAALIWLAERSEK